MLHGMEFSLAAFLNLVVIFVAVPTLVAAVLLWLFHRHLVRTRGADAAYSSGLPALAVWLLGFLAGLASFGLWLTWSAGEGGDYAVWQVVCCGATTLLAWWLVARSARRGFVGNLAATIGLACGFTAGFAALASGDSTGQSGVGVVMIGTGLGVTFGALGLARGAWQQAAR